MGIRASDLLRYAIRPTLARLAEQSGLPLASRSAEVLLLATAAQESHCGHWLHQDPGPARGIFQIEPTTYIWSLGELRRRFPKLSDAVVALRAFDVEHSLETNLAYATAVARARYWLVPHPLPEAGDFDAVWAYYKKWWNSTKGDATQQQFASNWARHGVDQAA